MAAQKPYDYPSRITVSKKAFSSSVRLSKSTIHGITHPDQPSPLSTNTVHLGKARLRELNRLAKEQAAERERGVSEMDIFKYTLDN